MKCNVLYMTYDGLTDPLGRSQILPYLTGLSKQGYSIHIISFEKPYTVATDTDAVKQICREHGIEWFPLQYHKSPPVLSTVYDLYRLKRLAFRLANTIRIGIVHCRSYPTALVGLQLQRRLGARLIFDMRGFWADERVEGRIWNIRNPVFKLIYAYFKRKEKELISQSDQVIVLTEKARIILNAWGRKDRVTVIPCCADTDFFDPARINEADKRELRKRLGIPSHAFVLCYAGSTGSWYMLDEMLDFFQELVSLYQEAQFLIMSPDPPREIIKRGERRSIKTEKLIIRKAGRDAMPYYYASADFTILFILNTFSKQGSSPTKLAEALAMGVPALANAGVGDNDILFKDQYIGLLIERFDKENYINAVKRIMDFSLKREQVRKFAIDHLSLAIAIERYKAVYEEASNSVSPEY